MSNLAKDWQEGEYSVRVEGNTVMVGAIRYEKMKGPYGNYLGDKKIIATAKCDPEDEFSLSMGVALAMDRLNKELGKDKIEVGDKVKIKNAILIYDVYTPWVIKNVHDITEVARYAYRSGPNTGRTYKVIAIAPHSAKDRKNLAYIEEIGSVFSPCYLIEVDGLEKV